MFGKTARIPDAISRNARMITNGLYTVAAFLAMILLALVTR